MRSLDSHNQNNPQGKRRGAPRHQMPDEKSVDLRRALVLVSALFVAIALVGAGIGTAFALTRKDATLYIDGESKQLYSWGNTVEDLLKDNGIKLKADDEIKPKLESSLVDEMKVNIKSARVLLVSVDGQEHKIKTTADSAAQAINEKWKDKEVLFIETFGTNRKGLELPLFPVGYQVELNHDGIFDSLTTRSGDTVERILQRKTLNKGDLDEISVVFKPQACAALRLVRIKEETVTITEEIPYATDTSRDESKYEDEKLVTQKGVKGIKEITKKIRTVDGQVAAQTVLAEKITREPVTEKLSVGIKKRPIAAPSGDVWAKLAFCESGGNPRTNTGNGYYGLYQFSASTWRAMGGSGLPSDASAEEQTRRAQILQQRSGWGQWPACSRKLGLR